MFDSQEEMETDNTAREHAEVMEGNRSLVDSISLRSVFNEAVEPHLFFALDGQLLDVNPSGCLYFGIDKEELIGLNFYDLLLPEDAIVFKEVLDDIYETGAGVLDVQFLTKNVGHLTTEMAYQLVESTEGRIIYARIRDMQVVRMLNRLLEERETSFKGAERLASLGSWEFYPEEDVIVWSDETFNIFGLPVSPKAPSFEEYLSKIHPDDVEQFTQTVQHAIKNGESYFIKHRIVRPDAMVRWVYGRGDVLVGDDGHIEKVYGTVQDITEEEHIREAMRKSEQRIRFHVDSSPLGYIEWNASFEVVEWNEAAERMFGFSKKEALAGLANIIPEEEAELVNQLVSELLSDQGGSTFHKYEPDKIGQANNCRVV